MRHIIVNRVTALVAALFLVAAALFVSIVTPPRDRAPAPAADTSPDGSALFDMHCASCHAVDELRPDLENLSDARRLELERFLADHGDTGPEEDRLILGFLSRPSP